MHNSEFVLDNETYFWDFVIQTDPLISARQPDLIIINKKKITYRTVDVAIPAGHRVKMKESEKKDTYKDFARELKKYGT